jgi:hypothetical protein
VIGKLAWGKPGLGLHLNLGGVDVHSVRQDFRGERWLVRVMRIMQLM